MILTSIVTKTEIFLSFYISGNKMSHPVYGSSPAYAVGTLYQGIQVGSSYFAPDGCKVVLTGKHNSTCGERWVTYIRLPGTNLQSNCSVPYGVFDFVFHHTKPVEWQIARHLEERKANLPYQRSKSKETAKYN